MMALIRLFRGEKIVHHSDLNGKVSLIESFGYYRATTCSLLNCADDIRYYEKYSHKDFEVVAVCMK